VSAVPWKVTKQAVLTICLLLAAGFVSAQDQTAAAERRSLSILLTNDDGYDAVGIQVLRNKLRSSGHRVTVVAPTEERSGSGAALTFTPFRSIQVAENEWKLDATPATCVWVGLSQFFNEAPDLVISGINEGHNIGASAPFSGTVGATVAALYAPIGGSPAAVPAIAFSADLPDGVDSEKSVSYRDHFEAVADFAVRTVEALVTPEGVALPTGMSLNVNYPGRHAVDIKGTVLTRQGRGLDFHFDFRQTTVDGASALVAEMVHEPLPVNDRPGSDVQPFLDGYITITPLDGDYSAGTPLDPHVHLALESLSPANLEEVMVTDPNPQQ